MGDGEGRGVRTELGNRIFLSEPFPSYVSLVAGLEQRGGVRGRDIWRILMFVSIFEIRRFIRAGWIVVRSLLLISWEWERV